MSEIKEPAAKKLKLCENASAVAHENPSDGDLVSIANIEKIQVGGDGKSVESENGYLPANKQNLNQAEVNVGIKLYLSIIGRFSGIIKQRYSDFMVRECDQEGNLVYLTNLDHIDNEEGEEEDVLLDDEELCMQIKEFAEEKEKESKLTLKPDNDKAHRTLIHNYVKQKYRHLDTGTVTLENGDRAVQVMVRGSGKNKRESANRRSQKADKIKNFCHCVLFKQNKDTMDCINLLAKKIHKKVSLFTYAGTKDRRATTIQKIAVKNTSSKQLAGLNKTLMKFNVALGNFTYSETALGLGDLSGNEFIIVVRNVTVDNDLITSSCDALRNGGFLNYFGLQRFGTGALPTYEIGKSLLSRNFEDAVNKILTSRENDPESAAKNIWKAHKDAKLALKSIVRSYSIEGKLLQALAAIKHPNQDEYNYKEAFLRLPRNTRMLYLHSYQSLVWNCAVSERIKKYGLQPCEGDLVLKECKNEKGFQQVQLLSKEDIDSKTYNIYDVVLPLPGFDMQYPGNALQNFFVDFLEKDGLKLDHLKMKEKDLALSGKYRKMLVKTKDMSWEIKHYEDYSISLIENDLDQLKKIDGTSKESTGKTEDSSSMKYKALKLKVTLPTSSYATMMLREILIHDASFDTQVMLNEQAKETGVDT